MKHYRGKIVEYTGKSKQELGVVNGETYEVSHTYGTNVAIRVGGNKIASIHQKNVKIVGLNKDGDELTVYSVLVLGKKPVGIRMVKGFEFYDIDLDSLTGLKKASLGAFDSENLIEDGDLLVTALEQSGEITVIDKSDDPYFCQQALAVITEQLDSK